MIVTTEVVTHICHSFILKNNFKKEVESILDFLDNISCYLRPKGFSTSKKDLSFREALFKSESIYVR